MPEQVLSLLLLLLSVHTAVRVEQMGDERFAVREAAFQSLLGQVRHDWGIVLLPVLEGACRHRDPEVARRARWAVEEFFNVRPTAWDAVPWIDMLPEKMEGRQAVMGYYLSRARSEVGTAGAPDWYDYRLATVHYVHDRLRAGTPRSQLVRLLDEMAANEERFLRRR